MKIETKFNIGDIFWKMVDNKPQSFPVQEIQIRVMKDGLIRPPKVVFLYLTSHEHDWIRSDETDMFVSKEALLASL